MLAKIFQHVFLDGKVFDIRTELHFVIYFPSTRAIYSCLCRWSLLNTDKKLPCNTSLLNILSKST